MLKDYLIKQMSVKEEDIQIFPSKNGWHVLCPHCFAIENDWRVTAGNIALEYARATYPNLTPEQEEDIINTINYLIKFLISYYTFVTHKFNKILSNRVFIITNFI